MAPEGLGEFRHRTHRRGIKVWFGPEQPPREHYEAQFISHRHLAPSTGEAGDGQAHIEIGFHAEHRDEAENEAALDHVASKPKVWKKALAGEVETGAFLGNDGWRRMSEVWLDVQLADDDIAFEVASRLVDYLTVIEPIRAER